VTALTWLAPAAKWVKVAVSQAAKPFAKPNAKPNAITHFRTRSQGAHTKYF